MEIIIRNRWTGEPIYTAKDVENVLQAVTEAIGNKANLTGANLTRADLYRADLTRADLTRADLTGANLTGANLTRADLTRANLYRANLTGANLYRANLTGANLTRAKGILGFFCLGPIGSRRDYLQIIKREEGLEIRTGCFSGTLEEFRLAVESTHDGNSHGDNYRSAIAFIEAYTWPEAKEA